jgi:hypothetical protein
MDSSSAGTAFETMKAIRLRLNAVKTGVTAHMATVKTSVNPRVDSMETMTGATAHMVAVKTGVTAHMVAVKTGVTAHVVPVVIRTKRTRETDMNADTKWTAIKES